MAEEFVPVIQAQGIAAQQPAHPLHQVAFGSLHDQVEVVAHQAASLAMKLGFEAGFGQGFAEVLPIDIVQEGVLPAVSTAHDVVNGPRILDSQLAWHGDILAHSIQLVNSKP